MPSHPRLIAGVVALTLVAVACSGSEGNATISLGDGALAPAADDIQTDNDGDSLIGLTFATLDGGSGSFDDHLGQPFVVNFFAAWCGPCRAELPEFQAVSQEFAADVGFLGISRDITSQDSINLVAETGVTYDVGWDEQDTLFPRLRLFAMPTTLFVDADGTITETWSGILSGDTLREKIRDGLL